MRQWIIDYLSFVTLIGMGIFVFVGKTEMLNFFHGFLLPIVYTSLVTVPLAVVVIIKEQLVKTNKQKKGDMP